jgi:hypothetical protein
LERLVLLRWDGMIFFYLICIPNVSRSPKDLKFFDCTHRFIVYQATLQLSLNVRRTSSHENVATGTAHKLKVDESAKKFPGAQRA